MLQAITTHLLLGIAIAPPNLPHSLLRQFPVKSEALRRAQLVIILNTVRIEGDRLYGSGTPITLPPNLSAEGSQSLSHPYYWAAFTLVGSPR